MGNATAASPSTTCARVEAMSDSWSSSQQIATEFFREPFFISDSCPSMWQSLGELLSVTTEEGVRRTNESEQNIMAYLRMGGHNKYM